MGKIKKYKGKFLTFHEARKKARTLGLKSKREWELLCKSKDKPKDIPANPYLTYKECGWINYADFLGYKPREKFLPFEQAREFVRSLGLKKAKADWAQYSRSGKRPENIPSTPKVVYKGQYKGIRDWIGLPEKRFLPFSKARKITRKLGLKTVEEWRDLCSSKNRPLDIPACPSLTYKEHGWTNYPDFLNYKLGQRFLPFEQARKFVRSLGLKRTKEWETYSSSGKRPRNIPSCPNITYKKEFKGFRDWIGLPEKNFLPFTKARKKVRALGLKDVKEWRDLCNSKNRPLDIPVCPRVTYKECGWINYPDFLGYKYPRFLPFNQARKFVRSMGFKTTAEWRKYSSSGKRPKDIPCCPNITYKKEFNGLRDWIGLSENIFLPFVEARKYVRENMTGRDWYKWCRDNRPSNIPIKPDVIYKNKGWKSWVDWFGKRKPKFLPYKKAKALARTLGIKGTAEWDLLCKQKKRPKELPACLQHYYKEFVSYPDFFGYKRGWIHRKNRSI